MPEHLRRRPRGLAGTSTGLGRSQSGQLLVDDTEQPDHGRAGFLQQYLEQGPAEVLAILGRRGADSFDEFRVGAQLVPGQSRTIAALTAGSGFAVRQTRQTSSSTSRGGVGSGQPSTSFDT